MVRPVPGEREPLIGLSTASGWKLRGDNKVVYQQRLKGGDDTSIKDLTQ